MPFGGWYCEGGIAGCGISLQYHPLLWWAGLRKVREKYHIYIYQWNYWIIKEICIKYNIHTYYLIFSKAQGLVVECTLISVELGRYEDLFTLENSYFYQPNVVYEWYFSFIADDDYDPNVEKFDKYIDFPTFYDFSVGFWNCFESDIFFCFSFFVLYLYIHVNFQGHSLVYLNDNPVNVIMQSPKNNITSNFIATSQSVEQQQNPRVQQYKVIEKSSVKSCDLACKEGIQWKGKQYSDENSGLMLL
jgi:hypothetical protein